MSTYRATVAAGGYTWTVTDDDEPAYGLADPLVLVWSLPTDTPRPVQPDPMVAQFAVITEHAADVRIGLGALVEIWVWFAAAQAPPADTAEPPDVWFRGRVTDATAVPSGTGMLYAFTCSDQTIDLTGADIGGDDQRATYFRDRLNMYEQYALPALVAPPGYAGYVRGTMLEDPKLANIDANLWVELRDGSPDSTLDALTELFGWVAVPGAGAFAGNTLYMPIVSVGPGPVGIRGGVPASYYACAIDCLPDRFIPSAAAPAPATFGQAPGGCYGVRVNENDRISGVLDACHVEAGVSWTAVKTDAIQSAVVTYLSATDTLPTSTRTPITVRVTEIDPPPGQAPVFQARETQTLALTGTPASVSAAAANADRLGHLLAPPLQALDGWSPDGFTWRLDLDPIGRDTFPIIFPLGRYEMTAAGQILRTVAYVRPIVITNVPASWNPTQPDRAWVTGQLGECRLVIDAGKPRIEFTLSPSLPDVGSPAGAANTWNTAAGTWDAQAGAWDDLTPGYLAFVWNDSALAGVTWDQLCRSDTWTDYQLVRGT